MPALASAVAPDAYGSGEGGGAAFDRAFRDASGYLEWAGFAAVMLELAAVSDGGAGDESFYDRLGVAPEASADEITGSIVTKIFDSKF